MVTTLTGTRRRHPRTQIDTTRAAQDLTHGHWVQIRNISEGGFLTASPKGAQVGEVHTFRAVLKDGDSCVLRATVIHCRPAVGTLTTCVIGWQAAADPLTAAAMRTLVEDTTAVKGGASAAGQSDDWDPECA
jgi:hypothetical protein